MAPIRPGSPGRRRRTWIGFRTLSSSITRLPDGRSPRYTQRSQPMPSKRCVANENKRAQFDIFLSHNRRQKAWVRSLARRLREMGLRVFFDEDSIEPGEDIVTAIERGLRSSRHIVLILSPEAVNSKWVGLEWCAAVFQDPGASERFVVPVLRQDCDIPWVLSRLKYIDVRGSSIDVAVRQIVAATSLRRRKVRSHLQTSTRQVSTQSVSTEQARLIGRDEELSDSLHQIRDSRTQTIILTGLPGIGKTCLTRSCSKTDFERISWWSCIAAGCPSCGPMAGNHWQDRCQIGVDDSSRG